MADTQGVELRTEGLEVRGSSLLLLNLQEISRNLRDSVTRKWPA